jgi:hypothetical protein
MRPKTLSSVLALALLGAVGCRRVDLVVTPNHVGTPFARVTSYMDWRGTRTEHAPGAVPNDAILDEMTLTSVSEDEFCGDVVIRTPAADDEPLSQLDVICSAFGGPPGAFATEEVRFDDYDYTGRATVFRADAVGPAGRRSVEITRPTAGTFRVVERRARLCCPTSGFGVVRVQIVNRTMPGRFVATWDVQR